MPKLAQYGIWSTLHEARADLQAAQSELVTILDWLTANGLSGSNADGRQGNINPTLYRLAAAATNAISKIGP